MRIRVIGIVYNMQRIFIRNLILAINLILLLMLTPSVQAQKMQVSRHDYYPKINANFFDEKGNKLFLDAYEGKVVLLVFWASWCGSCTNTLPLLDNLQKDFRKLPFQVLAISEDYHGVDQVKQYFESNEIRHLKIFHDYRNQLFKAFGIVSLPTALLINADGKVKLVFKGVVNWNEDKNRLLILDEMENNPEMPRNSYIPPVIQTVSKLQNCSKGGGKSEGNNNNDKEKVNVQKQ